MEYVFRNSFPSPFWGYVGLGVDSQRCESCGRNYIQKFRNLTEGLVSLREQDRFLDLVQCLPDLGASEIDEINVVLDEATLENETPDKKGIF